MAGSDLNAAQATLLFARAYTNHNTLIGIMREVNDLLNLMQNLRDHANEEVSV